MQHFIPASLNDLKQFVVFSVCFFGMVSFACAKTTVVFYPTNPDHQSDGLIKGTIEGQAVNFEYQYTYHFSSRGKKDFKANYIRLAADGEINVTLEVKAEITKAHLRALGYDLPFKRQGSNFQFTLPGPGNYYLQLPDLNTPGRITYTVFFFVDELEQYKTYRREFEKALNVSKNGIVSSSTIDQTKKIQALIDQGGTIYFPPGIYRTGQLQIPSDTTLLLGAGAVLKGIDGYNESRYIHIEDARNIRIGGMGTIDANGNAPGNQPTKGHLIDMENCQSIQLDGITFRNSNSWMLHIRRSNHIEFTGLYLFSGKDGIDPDGSSDVFIQDVTIQSIDDAFAVKSKFEGERCERVTMRNCIVFSCASSLKIGTENYYGVIRDITWDNCDAVDADRGIILYTNESGTAPISHITWRNIRVFNFDWEVETGGAPFQFENREGNKGGDITDILIQNVEVYPTTDVDVEQEAGKVNVTFQNVIVDGECQINDTENMTFKGVIWKGVTSESMPVVFIDTSFLNQNNLYKRNNLIARVSHPFDHKIKQVVWYVDGKVVKEDNASPYTFDPHALTEGSYNIVAKAMDEKGATNASAPTLLEILPEN